MSVLNSINGKLSIGARLGLMSGLFLASSGFVTTLLVSRAMDDINFSHKESEGAAYLENVWGAIRGGELNASAADQFNASAAASALAAAETDQARIASGLSLITAVADGSNLTLDPDLDSFYAMDAATVKIPALLNAALELEQAAATEDPARRAILVQVASAKLQGASDAARGSLEAAIANNASGETRSALSEPAAAIADATSALIAAANAGQSMGAARENYGSTLDASWRATATELARLLDVRVAEKRSELTMQLLLVALFLAAAGGLAWLVSTGLGRRMKGLIGTMDRLREGDFKVDVPFAADSHETGKIAQTLEFLRDDMGRRVEEDARRLEDLRTGAQGVMNALSRAQAVAEFSPDGKILTANGNYLKAFGCAADEMVGKHHSIFVSPTFASSAEYRAMWEGLARGETAFGKHQHVAKGGRDLWLQSSYNPITDGAGKVVKIVEIATDVTEQERVALQANIQSVALSVSPSAVMTIDRDFNVTFANEATYKLLRDLAPELRKMNPAFDPEKIVGQCIDQFHKAPSHQRALLSDVSRLPYKTDITLADRKIELNVAGIFDAQRKLVGHSLTWMDVTLERTNSGMLSALDKTQAVIEFTLDGVIVDANENFCQTLGYTIEEIRGQHHSMFAEADFRASAEYRMFWDKLRRGEPDSGKYLRIGKGGKEVWIQASYNPILDGSGKPFKVVKFATDITAAELQANEQNAKIEAISRSQAVIEFKPDGTILTANDNFLAVMGYSLSEIVGKHHSMFAPPGMTSTPEYRAFWERLGRGDFVADKFLRHGKGGAEVWIQASYNPLIDPKGRVFKVVKFASDITAVENERARNEEERARKSAEQAAVVGELAQGLGQLAAGDLTSRITQPFPGEYEKLRSDFNLAMTKLQDAVKTIIVNAGGIRTGAGEISQAADDLSRRTEQQAASLEETAAALDEITATVRKTAEGARQANGVVTTARSDAEESGKVVRETISAMSEIEKSSNQISQIIGVIDEIAFQTNLLALNAGVEAARAGEAGRGFAVVASEVRALAQRSSEAAKEIKGLIHASSQHVGAGVELVGEAGKALEVIVSKVSDISGLISEIAASAQEQATALAQVNTAINQMDQTTQQNAAMVEESTAASHSLTQESEELMSLVSRFEVGDVAQSAGARHAPRSHAPAPQRPQGETVAQQKQRVAQFASHGSAAVKSGDGDWEEF